MSAEQVMEAPFPAELLGKKRGDVKLLIVDRKSRNTASRKFVDIADYIQKGDVIVFNNSSLVRASIPIYVPSIGEHGFVHVGTSRRGNEQLVEIRPKELNFRTLPGIEIQLLGTGNNLDLISRHGQFRRFYWAKSSDGRDLLKIAGETGKILRYGHIPFDIPEQYYANATGSVPGSVEYPSGARPFTDRILDSLKSRGAIVRYLTLHCNLGSLEPYEFSNGDRLLEEQFTIPDNTSESISLARKNGNRIIAVGTSVVRALESAGKNGEVRQGKYSTDLFIHGNFNFKIVDSMVTGMHEEQGSHIDMISSFAGSDLIESAYAKATSEGYACHEFGDLAIIL